MPETTINAFTGVRADRQIERKRRFHSRIIKAAAYPVAGTLTVLLLSAALPPIVADQSDPAILDPPGRLLTTPNAGDDADAALFARLGLRPLAAEEPLPACAREAAE